jgi:hypothetical protein
MKKFLYLILLLFPLRAGAQVSMAVQLPPAGVLLKAQLWNIVIVSASELPQHVKVTLRLMDAQTNQPVLTGITRSIVLTKGAKQLQVGDVMPVQYEYLSATVDRSVNGMLPAGKYLACYSLVVVNDKTGNQPGEDCIPFVVEPVSPPLLNTPANQSILETTLPQFTWLPPAPVTMFNDLNYEMILTEVHPGQSAQEAIQQNMAVYRAPRLKNVFVNYPAGAVALDTSKQYAWSVIARNGLLFAAQTEVWTFRVHGVNNSKQVLSSAYVQLKKDLDGAVVNCSGLQCGYDNEAGDTTVPYQLIALEDNNRIVYTGALHVNPGNNRMNVPLGKRKALESGKSYLFRLHNTRNEYWQVKFIYTKEK